MAIQGNTQNGWAPRFMTRRFGGCWQAQTMGGRPGFGDFDIDIGSKHAAVRMKAKRPRFLYLELAREQGMAGGF